MIDFIYVHANNMNKTFHYRWEEHLKISKIAKLGGEIL